MVAGLKKTKALENDFITWTSVSRRASKHWQVESAAACDIHEEVGIFSKHVVLSRHIIIPFHKDIYITQ